MACMHALYRILFNAGQVKSGDGLNARHRVFKVWRTCRSFTPRQAGSNHHAYCQSALLEMLLPFRLLYSSPKRAKVGTTSAVTGTGKLKVADVAKEPG